MARPEEPTLRPMIKEITRSLADAARGLRWFEDGHDLVHVRAAQGHVYAAIAALEARAAEHAKEGDVTKHKAHLGDGAYVDVGSYAGEIVLTAEDGIRATDTIYLDEHSWKKLMQWRERTDANLNFSQAEREEPVLWVCKDPAKELESKRTEREESNARSPERDDGTGPGMEKNDEA